MHRFYLPSAASSGPSLTLTEREARHALQVLRVQRGEQVAVLDGKGNEFLCEIVAADRRTLTLSVLQKNFIPPLPYALTLAQAVTKGKAMDWIVQKATELGAHRIVPILCERSVTKVEAESALAKVEKWKAIAIESIKQCGSAWLPEIDVPTTIQAILADLSQAERFDLVLVATLGSDGRHPREHFERFRAVHHRAPRSICVWIGPEGDFTPEEILAVKSAGALPITLGPLVLRSDTAAIGALAILSSELQTNQERR